VFRPGSWYKENEPRDGCSTIPGLDRTIGILAKADWGPTESAEALTNPRISGEGVSTCSIIRAQPYTARASRNLSPKILPALPNHDTVSRSRPIPVPDE
jgi:hypothetical protein